MKIVARMLVLVAAFGLGVQSFGMSAPATSVQGFNVPLPSGPGTPVPGAQVK